MLVPEDVFFSVAVRDGISQDNANVEDVTYVGPGLFGSSNITPEREIRQRHLQWCQHKGPKDAFQPMLFWRTSFIEESDFCAPVIVSSRTAKSNKSNSYTTAADKSSPSGITPCSNSQIHEIPDEKSNFQRKLLTRYLSQVAADQVFPDSSAQREANTGKRNDIVVFIVCPDHYEDQSKLLQRLWEDAFPRGSGIAPNVSVEYAKPENFDKHRTILSHHSNKSNGRKPRGVDIDQLALLRGAGLLYGYPLLLFDGNATSTSFICADNDGTLIGNGNGIGISARLAFLALGNKSSGCLKSKKRNMLSDTRIVSDSDDLPKSTSKIMFDNRIEIREMERKISHVLRHAALVGESTFDNLESFTGDISLEASMDDTFKELAKNGRCIIARWLVSVKNTTALDYKNDQFMRKFEVFSRWSKMAHSVKKKVNKEMKVITSGSDCEILSYLLCSTPSTSSINLIRGPSCTIDSKFLIEQEKEKVNPIFPWIDSTSSFWVKENEDEEESHDHYKKIEHYPIIQNKFLIHYGITASLMVQFLLHLKPNACESNAQLASGNTKQSLLKRHEGNTSDDELETARKMIGDRVAKAFLVESSDPRGNKETTQDLYRGSVSKVERGTDGEVWVFIKYDDGDSEHVSMNEGRRIIKAFQMTGEKKKPENKKNDTISIMKNTRPRRGDLTNNDSRKKAKTMSSQNLASETEEPLSLSERPRRYLQSRIAKVFDDCVFFGVIVDVEIKRSISKPHNKLVLWRVVFDDGDQKRFSELELDQAFKLYSKMKHYDNAKTA